MKDLSGIQFQHLNGFPVPPIERVEDKSLKDSLHSETILKQSLSLKLAE